MENEGVTQYDAATLAHLRDRVFGNSLILETIMKCALFEEGKLIKDTVKACRLVSPSWLERVVALQNRTDRGVLSLNSKDDPNTLLRFVDTFAVAPPERIPAFSLHIFPPSGSTDSEGGGDAPSRILETVLECVERCGSRLLHLSIMTYGDIFDGQNPFPGDAELLQFPHLKTIELSEIPETESEEGHRKFRKFVQTLLTRSKCLKKLVFQGHVMLPLPEGTDLSGLQLPPTLTTIRFQLPTLTPRDWGLLQLLLADRNLLPHLRDFIIHLSLEDPHTRHQLSQVLRRYKGQLQFLELGGSLDNPDVPLPLPVMPLVKTFICGAVRREVTPDNGPALETLLPLLKSFSFRGLPYPVLREWLEPTRSSTVEIVNAQLVPDTSPRHPEGTLSPQMDLLRSAFPSVTKLHLILAATPQMSAVAYIFKYMTTLQELDVIFNKQSQFLTSAQLNALLLGVNLAIATVITHHPEKWMTPGYTPTRPGILRMTALTHLQLYGTKAFSINLTPACLAFQQMPRLEEVRWEGRPIFQAPPR